MHTTSLASSLVRIRRKENEQAATRSLGSLGNWGSPSIRVLILLLLPLFRGLSLQNASILSVGLKSTRVGYKAELESGALTVPIF